MASRGRDTQTPLLWGHAPQAADAGGRESHGRERSKPSVSIVIPTLNEAQNLPHILPQLDQTYEVVIVDGRSTDGTVEIAKALRPTALIVQQPRRGKGDALIAGFLAASGDIIVTLDADGSQKVDEIPRFVAALQSGADFAKGSRLVAGGGSADFTWLRAAGNRGLGMAANLMHGTSYTDLTYGYNAFWRHCLTHIVSEAEGFEGEIIMYIRAARAGLRITEVPCYEERRIFGESNLRTFRDGWRILRMLVTERRYPATAGVAAQASVTAAREGL